MIRAVILDFDGVIIESNALKTQAFVAVFSRFPEHAAAMMAYHHAHVSDSRFAKFRHLATQYLGRSADDPIVDELGQAFSDEMLRQVLQCPMVPGAQAFLDDVSSRVPVYLASVTPQDELDQIVDRRQFRRYFSRVYGCPPWTKPEAIRDILHGLGGPQDVVFVGDSAGDQRAAQETQVEFIARNSGLPFDPPIADTCATLFDVHHRLLPRLPPARSAS